MFTAFHASDFQVDHTLIHKHIYTRSQWRISDFENFVALKTRSIWQYTRSSQSFGALKVGASDADNPWLTRAPTTHIQSFSVFVFRSMLLAQIMTQIYLIYTIRYDAHSPRTGVGYFSSHVANCVCMYHSHITHSFFSTRTIKFTLLLPSRFSQIISTNSNSNSNASSTHIQFFRILWNGVKSGERKVIWWHFYLLQMSYPHFVLPALADCLWAVPFKKAKVISTDEIIPCHCRRRRQPATQSNNNEQHTSFQFTLFKLPEFLIITHKLWTRWF